MSLMDDPFAIVVSQDEVHFMRQTGISRIWCPTGSTPIVGSPPGKDGVLYSGFVILGKENGHVFVTKPDVFTFETTIASIREFLERYPIPSCCKFHMILDNAPWHRKAKRLIKEDTSGEYSDINDKVVFINIPSYSPDLNPIEILWRVVRREVTNNQYFPYHELFEQTIDAYLGQFAIHSEKIATRCSFNFNNEKKTPKKYFPIGLRYMVVHTGKKIRRNNRVKTMIIRPESPLPVVYYQHTMVMRVWMIVLRSA